MHLRSTAFYLFCALYISAAIALSGCKEDKLDEAKFDRSEWLMQMADEQVLPRLTALEAKLSDLEVEAKKTGSVPSTQQIQDLRSAWYSAAAQLALANNFNIGPGKQQGILRPIIEEVGTYPVDPNEIENRIATGSNDVSGFRRDTRGLHAVEYLLYGNPHSGNRSLGTFTDCAAQDSCGDRINYLRATLSAANKRVDLALEEWNANYRKEFVEADGTSVSASVTKLYNEYVQSFDRLRDIKLAIPLGLTGDQMSPRPELQEAYYSDRSLELVRLHLESLRDQFLGIGSDGELAVGWDDYLNSVVQGEELAERISQRYARIFEALDKIPQDESFTGLLAAGDQRVITFHDELETLSPLLRGEVSSLLGLAITATSSDGD